MQRLTLDLTVGTRQSAARLGIVGGIDACDVPLLVGVVGVVALFVTFNYIGVLQPHLLARSQAHELLLGHGLEVVALNPELA